jgi:elongation factor G
MVNRLGKVDEGNTVTDFDEEEIARKHTLSASLAFAEWNKTKINLIDTPGFANFFSDARAALRVWTGSCGVDAVSGPEGRPRRRAAAEEPPAAAGRAQPLRSRPRLARTHHRRPGKTCHRSVMPIHLPIGEGEACTGIVDVVGMSVHRASGRRPAVEGPIPEALAGRAGGAHGLIEAVAKSTRR